MAEGKTARSLGPLCENILFAIKRPLVREIINNDKITIAAVLERSGGSRRSCWGRQRGSGMPLIPLPIYRGQNVLETFEMAIRHNRRH